MFDEIIIKEMSPIDAYNYGRQMAEKELNKIHLCECKQIRAEVIAEISREMRMLYGNEYEKQIRVDAIDEFVKAIEKHQTRQDSYLDPPYVEMGLDMTDVIEVAEQLKEQK